MVKPGNTLMYVVVIIFGAYCLSLTVVIARKQMCSKILFKNINENDMPWIQVEGVYKLFSTNDGFPVYSNALSGLFFYYNRDAAKRIKTLTFGNKIGNVFGLLALLPVDFDPERWRNTGNLNKNDVFGDAVISWKYYSPREKTFKDVSGKIKAICVDDDVFRCSSGKVYLNDVITGSDQNILNDPKTDYFSELQGIYSEIRPVFKHSRQNWYLYYRSEYWRVGTSYVAAKTNDIFRVQDLSVRPEFLTQHWQKWTGTEWIDIGSELRVLCRGIANGDNKCQGRSTCKHLGTCVHTKGNETVCICSSSAYGPYCEQTERCSDPGTPHSAVDVVWTGKRPGDIATVFCTVGYKTLSTEFYICSGQAGVKKWYLESEASCQTQEPTFIPRTTTPRGYSTRVQTTEKPWDKSLDFVIFFGPCLAFQLLVPCFIWLGLTIAGLIRVSRKTQSRSLERIEAVTKVQDRKSRRLLGVYSAFLNFVFWPWLFFVCACASTDLHERHEYLYYCAIGMCLFCAVFVAIEGFWCRERIALQNIVTWEYIERLQTNPPIIEMQVERFDWKYVQEAGYRTNPTTGNLEYRDEIRRKVGKKFVREPFVFGSWCDASDRENLFEGHLTTLRLNVVVTLEGETTKESFKEQKEALIRKTDHLNLLHDFARKDKVADVHPYVILCRDRQSIPSWVREEYFWYATFLQLSWVFRWLLNSKAKFAEYTVRKQVFSDRGEGRTGVERNEQGNGSIQATQCALSSNENLTDVPEAEGHQKTPLISNANQQQKSYMTV